MWDPKFVGVLPSYPKTEEAFLLRQERGRQLAMRINAAGLGGRHGVPDGWAGKKKLINQINAAALAEAKEVVEDLIKHDKWVPDNEESATLLAETMKIILAERHTPDEEKLVPLYNVKDRLTAINTAWKMVQRAPVARTDNKTVISAEEFLESLADKE